MLLIIYGAIAEMGFKSREYLQKNGFQSVEKYNYAVNPILTTKFGTRNYVSKEEFLEKTDSLFRYEVGGIHVGFSQKQISDAVCDNTNSLLTLSTKDISFLADIKRVAEIKRVYAEKVCLVYTYIDDTTLKNIISGLANITDEEARVRYEMGCDIKKNYLKYQDIFDRVIIYGGEGSVFDYDSLYRQLDKIIATDGGEQNKKTEYADVFISCTRKDNSVYSELRSALTEKGISVFDDAQISLGSEWVDNVSDAIQNAKIVIPVITNNALSSPWIMEEVLFALESAEKNGTSIIPVLDMAAKLDEAPALRSKIEFLNGAVIENGNIKDASYRLADKIHKLLSAEADMRSYAKQVENYIYLKMYDKARCLQEAHLALCTDVFVESNGAFVDFEACLLSRIKLISILLDMELYDEALEHSIDALNQLDDGDTHDVLADQFALCCAHLGTSYDGFREMALKRLIKFAMFSPDYDEDDRMQVYMRSYLDDISDRFNSALRTLQSDKNSDFEDTEEQTNDESKIAEYGEFAISLFEDVIKKESGGLNRCDLILGYERILNYCKHMGLKGEVADKCISRIAELSADEELDEYCESTASEALKIYLGQALPKSGQYDVFISFKSQDEVLARKVYDYLTQSGKEVFFAKETLPQLGDGEYRPAIFEALDCSKHMVIVSSNPEYLKTKWVKKEWDIFDNEMTEGRKDGTLILVLSDDIACDKGNLPIELRTKEIVKMSEFRNRLLSYLR